ncbi:KLHL4, partial [Symbiodinium necroappetens]
MWKEKWVGPANLDRASLRITGMDTYALVAAVLLQVITGLYGSVPEPDESNERIKYPALQRFMYESQMFLSSVSVVCSTYTMVMFLLCKIYTVMALGMYKDVSYDLFQQNTARFRLRAFWSLIIAMHSFLVSFAMNLFTRVKGKRGLFLCVVTMMGIAPVVYDWKIIYEVAERYVYKSEVLSVHSASAAPQDLEAALANWNIGLDDAGAGAFAGPLRFDNGDPGGCHPPPSGSFDLEPAKMGGAADDLLARIERLERIVEDHGKRLDDVAPRGGRRDARRGETTPPINAAKAPVNRASSAAANRRAGSRSPDVPRATPILATSPRALRAPGVYVCGGHASGVTLGATSRLNSVTGIWEPMPSMPTPRHGCCAASMVGIIYVVGGANESALPLDIVERFDPAGGSWETLPPMPTP